MADTTNERFDAELAMLENIFTAEEVSVCEKKGTDGETMILMTVHPATAGEAQLQYVCLKLHITLPASYPDESPYIEVRNPRGLSEPEVENLKKDLLDYIVEERGAPVLMQIFQIAQDALTETNIPHGVCSICLCDFKEASNDLFKTNCYHYFHLRCIVTYKDHWQSETAKDPQDVPAYMEAPQEQFRCPECREPVHVPDTKLDELPKEDFVYVISEEMKSLQEIWKDRYERQLAAGGIIDLEKEKVKHRLPSTPPPPEVTEEVDAEITGERPVSQVDVTGSKTNQDSHKLDSSVSALHGHHRRGGSHNKHSRGSYSRNRYHHPIHSSYNHHRANHHDTAEVPTDQQPNHRPSRRYSSGIHVKSNVESGAENPKSASNTSDFTELHSGSETNDVSPPTSAKSSGMAGGRQGDNPRPTYRRPTHQPINRQNYGRNYVNSNHSAKTVIANTTRQETATPTVSAEMKSTQEGTLNLHHQRHSSHQLSNNYKKQNHKHRPDPANYRRTPDDTDRPQSTDLDIVGGKQTVPEDNARSHSRNLATKGSKKTMPNGYNRPHRQNVANDRPHFENLATKGKGTVPNDNDRPHRQTVPEDNDRPHAKNLATHGTRKTAPDDTERAQPMNHSTECGDRTASGNDTLQSTNIGQAKCSNNASSHRGTYHSYHRSNRGRTHNNRSRGGPHSGKTDAVPTLTICAKLETQSTTAININAEQ
ncbi:E3 ubiquitin-protein ligase RNF25-like [Watersipora subatra]|uniref:E3 ubiquitin-protein ligase RNF25-like n=1 Tax=Watersipora subatra TaxID=2589382 RepID=UPI00355B3835